MVHRHDTRRAGHATGGIPALRGGTGLGAFADLWAIAPSLTPAVRDTVFVLAFLGFGSKGHCPIARGFRARIPLPSHVSALMSGVMIKMGVYGLLRLTLDLLGGGPAWWGGLVLAVGVVSALLGVLYALMEHDLKRLLAFHSVENIGIILIGIGAGLMFHRYGLMPPLHSASSAGCIMCSIMPPSRACCFGAGSVLHATHTRNMEEMGGLIKRMP